MYGALITLHVILMIASLMLMPTAIALAFRGARSSIKVATCGMVVATLGVVAGAALLIQAPVLSECIVLTSYLLAMASLYGFGFGWGAESKARLLRTSEKA